MQFKYRHRVLLLLFILSAITFLDRVCISDAGPRIQEDLHLTKQQWGWILGIFAFAYAAFEIPSGTLGDLLGPRRVLTRIVTWWSCFTALTASATSYGQLLVIRFLFGMGEAGAYPNSSICIARWFPPAEHGFAQGMVFTASRLGGALAPLLVIPIQQAYGWRASFVLFGSLGLVWAMVWHGWYRDPKAEVSDISRHHGSTPWTEIRRSKNLGALMSMTFTYHYGAYFYLTWLPEYLTKVQGFSARWAALPFILGAMSNSLGGLLTDRMVLAHGLRWGRRLIGMVGLGGAAVCMVVAILAANHGVLALIFLSCCYACMELIVPTNWAVCLDIGSSRAGTISACMNTAGQLGGFVSPVAFGYLLAQTGSYRLALTPTAALMVCGAALWMYIDASQKIFPESSESVT